MHSERVTYLATADQKAALEKFARTRGESVGSVLREAVSEYMAQPTPQEEAELAALVEQVNEAIPKMNASIDRMSETLRRSREKLDHFLREKGLRA